MKVGLVGAGGIAHPHLKAYVRNRTTDAVAIADPSAEARHRMQDEYGIIKEAYESYEPLLEDDDVAVIDICTPHYVHHRQAIAALEAGKDVILEKPIAMTAEEADEMMATAKRTGRRLFCALCQRMFPAHQKAKEIIDAGEIGEPFLGIVNVIGDEFGRMNDAKSWKGDWDKAGGGALFDTGYHAIYMLQHFLGNATAVTASTRRLIVEPKNKADDTSVVALEVGERRSASITVTYSATGSPWSEARWIIGTEGSLQILDDGDEVEPLSGFHEKEFVPIPVHNPPNVNGYAIRLTLDHFIDCITSGKESEITLYEARAALVTARGAYESSKTGRRVELEHVAPSKRAGAKR